MGRGRLPEVSETTVNISICFKVELISPEWLSMHLLLPLPSPHPPTALHAHTSIEDIVQSCPL